MSRAPVSVLLAQNTVIQKLYPDFLGQSLNAPDMRIVIQNITAELIKAAKARDKTLTNATLIPILRGGLPMYITAQEIFPKGPCLLVRCSKLKGTTEVAVDWFGRRPYPVQPDDGHILLLDTVIASGDTLLRICDELFDTNGGVVKQVTVLSCYVSPNGLEVVSKHPIVKEIITGFVANGYDENGLLVPYPGDIGDKLYGSAKAV